MPNPAWLFMGERFSEQDQIADYEFGSWVRKQRNQMTMTYYEAAFIADMEPSRWIAIERGGLKKAATKKECEKIALVFGVPSKAVLQKAAG